MEYVAKFFKLLKENKGKIFIMIVSAFAFIFVLFPFDDLSDLISSQVAKVTNNAVYVQFERLKMSLFPHPGVDPTGC